MTKKLRTTGCFMEYNGKFLILHRHPSKVDGDTWGLPAGKVSANETDEQAVLREIKEETGYSAQEYELKFLGQYDFDFEDLFLEFPTYRLVLKQPVEIVHNPDEHVEWKWVTAKECYAMPNLIRGFHNLLEMIGYVVVGRLS